MPNVFFLPSVSLDQRDRLPTDPGVYYACSMGRILYIGKADGKRGLRQRWTDNGGYGKHHKLPQLRHYPDPRIYYWTRPRWRVEHDEAVEIKRLKPPLNNRYEKTVRWIGFLDASIEWGFGIAIALVTAWILFVA